MRKMLSKAWDYVKNRRWEDRISPVDDQTVFLRGDKIFGVSQFGITEWKVTKAGTFKTCELEYLGLQREARTAQ